MKLDRVRQMIRAADAVAERILQLLDDRGHLKKAERGGLERDIVLKLAKRIKPDDALDFERAVAELENAVTIALDAIARGRARQQRGRLRQRRAESVGAHTQAGENERAVKALDDALKELDNREAEQHETLKRSRMTLLEAGIEQDILRRDAPSAARRVERVVRSNIPMIPPHVSRHLRERQDAFDVEGRDKGINFSLEIAIEIALPIFAFRPATQTARQRAKRSRRCALDTGRARERHRAPRRGGRGYREALKECTRERVPLDWAMTQNNLGNALRILGERESGTARLEEAVAAYREALKERTRERAPLEWATTQNNLGNALATLGERESGTAGSTRRSRPIARRSRNARASACRSTGP